MKDTTHKPEEDEEQERDEPMFFIQPVGEPITIGPLAGAVQFIEGWFYSPWFGVFRIDEGPDPSWVYHVQLGWIYVSGNSSENLWLWSENPELGWLWTHREFLSLKENVSPRRVQCAMLYCSNFSKIILTETCGVPRNQKLKFLLSQKFLQN